jgi:hypothetical protein
MQEEALVEVTAQCVEQRQLFRGFDTFCHHLQAQIVGQRDNPVYQGRTSLGAPRKVLNEGPIDLDNVHVKILEVTE